MSEIQRSDVRGAGGGDATSGADRDAKIEQLLLAGLDHYFAAQYEQAINVWTRALFLDRTHARARAYIERARGALAERQRQSEELLHNGVAAYQRGEGDEARRLLQAAIEAGAPTDEALPVLERLNRQPDNAAGDQAPAQPRPRARERWQERAARQTHGPTRVVVALALVAGAAALGMYVASGGWFRWTALIPFAPLADSAPSVSVAPIAQDVSLPLPRRGEMALARARTLAAGGRLHEALIALERVRATDPQKDDADRLRADIQRQLLALTPMPAAVPAPPDRRQP